MVCQNEDRRKQSDVVPLFFMYLELKTVRFARCVCKTDTGEIFVAFSASTLRNTVGESRPGVVETGKE